MWHYIQYAYLVVYSFLLILNMDEGEQTKGVEVVFTAS